MANSLGYVTSEDVDGVLVLTITESTLKSYELIQAIRDEMIRAVAAADAKDVVLDLGNVQMMSSASILVLTRLNTAVKSRDGQLVLCSLSDFVAQTLTVSQLIVERRGEPPLLAMADDVPSAIAQLNAA
jgi:anti-anti-sigma factor